MLFSTVSSDCAGYNIKLATAVACEPICKWPHHW